MTRVAIVAEAAEIAEYYAALLQQDDRFELVEYTTADVVLALELSVDDVEDGGPPTVLISDVSADELRLNSVLPMNSSPAEITGALLAAAAGLFVLTRDQVTARDNARGLPPAVDLVEPLTARELQVLRFLADGLANKEIAFQLSMSIHTAKFHVAQILAKLDAATRAEAVTIGIRLGLIPL